MFQLPTPQSSAPYISEGTKTRSDILAQPTPGERILPEVLQIWAQASQRNPQLQPKSEQEAATVKAHLGRLSEYLSMPEEMRQSPGVKRAAMESALTLGLTQMPFQQHTLTLPEQIYRAGAIETAKDAAKAQFKTPPQGTTAAPDDMALADAFLAGKFDVTRLPAFGQARAKVYKAIIAKQPDANIFQIENSYQKQKAVINYEAGTHVQTPVRLIDSVLHMLPVLSQQIAALPLGNVQPLNQAIIDFNRKFRGGSQAGIQAQEYVTQLGEVRAQLAQVFQAGGVPTDFATKRAVDILPEGVSKSQALGVIQRIIPQMMQARSQALQGKTQLNILGVPLDFQKMPIPATMGQFPAQSGSDDLEALINALSNGQNQ